MDIERHFERCGGFVDSELGWIVGVFVAGASAEHRAFESELADAALQFFGGGFGVGSGKRGEALEAVGALGDQLGGEIVAAAGEIDGLWRVEALHAGGGEGQYLDVDAVVVHVFQARAEWIAAHVEQAVSYFAGAKIGGDRILQLGRQSFPGGVDFGSGVVLFEGDDFHGDFL